MKKVCFLLAFLLLLSGCSGNPEPTQPTTIEPLPSGSTAPTVPTTTAPAELPFVIPEEFTDCEIITPEEGVMILHGEEDIKDQIIDGDVYITANADVTFDNVWIRGNLYVHGRLTATGYFYGKKAYAHKVDNIFCSAYDGIHSEIKHPKGIGSIEYIVKEDALDYAFDTWGKVEPIAEPLKEIRLEEEPPVREWDEEVRILSGKQNLISESIRGDVYIASDGDITFYDVHVSGNVYVYGKLHFSDYGTDLANIENQIGGRLYAYDFGVTCEVFDGVHGQVTGGPVRIFEGYMIANDALDYAFDTWGKQ